MIILGVVLTVVIIYWTYLSYRILVWSRGSVPKMEEALGSIAVVTMLPRILFRWFKDQKYFTYDDGVCTSGYNELLIRGKYRTWGEHYVSSTESEVILDYDHPSNGWWVRGIKDHLRDNGIVGGVFRWHGLPVAVFTLSGVAFRRVRKTAGQVVVQRVPNEDT